jgi:hypothetical protein
MWRPIIFCSWFDCMWTDNKSNRFCIRRSWPARVVDRFEPGWTRNQSSSTWTAWTAFSLLLPGDMLHLDERSTSPYKSQDFKSQSSPEIQSTSSRCKCVANSA